ncbi:MAG TPA: pyridine nucleotide-disulfide oxidoreductase [Caldithrix abyssi]|uniref:Pyridine nucleotide-disulfide oxidoreductase n=1 Tax=Caldithrix abyssi TaxID=187145 RepID=A0A7V5H332_CALAY|nr:pyridine nucleotide-disulfide oxidoreductase [Caldithrix abyssi]
MKKYNIVIVGGGPAGVTAAISSRNTYPDKTIALIRREKIPMIPCGIPYILHSLNSIDENILPDAPLHNKKVDILVDEVVARNDHILELASGEKVEYEKLVLATGSQVFVPPIKGIDLEGVFYVKKNKEYLETFKEKTLQAKKIIIIGGGFIGLEVADELLKAGKQVVIIERLGQLLPLAMDSEFGDFVAEKLRGLNAEILTGVTVKEIIGQQKVEGVIIDDGRKIDGDLVVVSAGYRPNIELAKKLGLEYNERFGILIDEYLRTSEKDIFAVGDCAAKRNCFTGEFTQIMLASTAMAEGRLAGSNLYDIKVIRKFMGILGSFSTKIAGVALGVSGMTERDAKALGIDYVVGTTETFDRHPGKLPGASKIYVKLIFSRYSHTILGGQVRGGNSVGEIVNILSVMIQKQMTDMEIDTLQIGTHPLLTASPIAYPIINATADAIVKWLHLK